MLTKERAAQVARFRPTAGQLVVVSVLVALIMLMAGANGCIPGPTPPVRTFSAERKVSDVHPGATLAVGGEVVYNPTRDLRVRIERITLGATETLILTSQIKADTWWDVAQPSFEQEAAFMREVVANLLAEPGWTTDRVAFTYVGSRMNGALIERTRE